MARARSVSAPYQCWGAGLFLSVVMDQMIDHRKTGGPGDEFVVHVEPS
jgi:hypothetical protein